MTESQGHDEIDRETPVERANSLEDLRVERARQLAVDTALRQERVETRLTQHEQRLTAINGSVARAAENFLVCDRRVDALHGKFDAMRAEQNTRDAVNSALTAAVEKANKSQISNRTFLLGVVAIMVPILIAIISNAHLFG